MNRIKLSKTVSYILRHHPEDFGLKLEADGSVELEALVKSLRRKFPELTENDVIELVENDSKGRFSLLADNNRIKANYGHSLENINPDYDAVKPPEYLFHGSRPEVKEDILAEGLQPMSRRYVHLSQTVDEALKVARRRTNNPVVFKVQAIKAYEDGLKFYKAGTQNRGQAGVEIYLTKEVNPEYLLEV